MSLFRVKYHRFTSPRPREAADGVFAYEAGAALRRDSFFVGCRHIARCWIERGGEIVGDVLIRERTPKPVRVTAASIAAAPIGAGS